MNARYTDSCPYLFKNLKILQLKSKYIFPLLLFVAKNRDCMQQIHNINTRFTVALQSATATAKLTTLRKERFHI
jgi:hypothetical protein